MIVMDELDEFLEWMTQEAAVHDIQWRRWKDQVSTDAVCIRTEEIIAAYLGISDEDRFRPSKDASLPRIPEGELRHWEEWSEAHLAEPFLERHPTVVTWAVHHVLLRGGIEVWLRWLNRLPRDWEIVSLLWDCSDKEGTQRTALRAACKGNAYPRLQPLLLFSLLLDPQTEDETLAQIIRENAEPLSEPCFELLTDYTFLLRYPMREQTWETVNLICAKEMILTKLEAGAEQNQGKLAALARLIVKTEALGEHPYRYGELYLRWIADTELLFLQQDLKGSYTEQELGFLANTANILTVADDAAKALERLWPRKTARFYGWTANKRYSGNAWFQHIGLVLWRIGLNRYGATRDERLILAVMERMNRYISEALNENAYDLLLLNLLSDTFADTTAVHTLQIQLIRKVTDLSLLLETIPHQLEAEHPRPEVLSALRERLLILLQLPQKKRITEREIHMAKEQLQELNTRLHTPDVK